MAFTIAMCKVKWQNLIPTEDQPEDADWTNFLADALEDAECDIDATPDDTVVKEKQLVLWRVGKILKMNVSALSDAESSPGGSTTFPSVHEINRRIRFLKDKINGVIEDGNIQGHYSTGE